LGIKERIPVVTESQKGEVSERISEWGKKENLILKEKKAQHQPIGSDKDRTSCREKSLGTKEG